MDVTPETPEQTSVRLRKVMAHARAVAKPALELLAELGAQMNFNAEGTR